MADDLGMDAQINDAILHAHEAGELHAASLMMSQPGTEEAVEIARATPALQVGWHLHLSDSVPATTDHWPWGASPAKAGFALGFSPAARRLMRREVSHQWRLFQETGLGCRFINSHHHLHAHPFVYRALREEIGPCFDGWIRMGTAGAFGAPLPLAWRLADAMLLRGRRRNSSWRHTDTLWGLDRLFKMDAHEVRSALALLPPGFHEFLFHPRSRCCPDTQCLLDLKSSPSSA